MRSTNTRTSFLSVAAIVSALTLAFVLVAPASSDTETSWGLDPAHTEINFSVKHFFRPGRGGAERWVRGRGPKSARERSPERSQAR